MRKMRSSAPSGPPWQGRSGLALRARSLYSCMALCSRSGSPPAPLLLALLHRLAPLLYNFYCLFCHALSCWVGTDLVQTCICVKVELVECGEGLNMCVVQTHSCASFKYAGIMTAYFEQTIAALGTHSALTGLCLQHTHMHMHMQTQTHHILHGAMRLPYMSQVNAEARIGLHTVCPTTSWTAQQCQSCILIKPAPSHVVCCLACTGACVAVSIIIVTHCRSLLCITVLPWEAVAVSNMSYQT